MGGIFVSYRRDDSRHAAGRLVDRLTAVYAADQLFMDVDNIELGLDFAKVLSDKVAQCDAMLVIIGPRWLDARDAAGNRRLDDANDFVRIEVESALARDVRVIPVLVDGADLPRAEELPPSLRGLTRRQATRLNHERFGSEAEAMTEALTRIVPPSKKGSQPIDLSKALTGIAASFLGQIKGNATATAATARVEPAAPEASASERKTQPRWRSYARVTGNFFYGAAWFYSFVFLLAGITMAMGTSRADKDAAPWMILLGLLFAISTWRWRTKRIAAGAGPWGFKPRKM